MFTMEPIEPIYFDQSHTRELVSETRYAELVARLIRNAYEEGRPEVVVPILAAAYPRGFLSPHRRDIAEFERSIVAQALTEAEASRWCDSVHEALAEAFSPVWELFPDGVSPLYLNSKFHHPDTGLAWDGDHYQWHVNCRAELDTGEAPHCACGHQCTDVCRRSIGIVEDSREHHFHSTDSPTMESCYQCGGMFTLLVNADGYEYYRGGDGESIVYCTGDTGQVHGEQPCDQCEGDAVADDGSCVHTRHECNCLHCRF